MGSWRLQFNSETENKHRWATDVDGVAFKLYIPKYVVPNPVPEFISVKVQYGRDLDRQHPPLNKDEGVFSEALFRAEHTETVQYTPPGESKTWVIGEPYVPMSILPKPWPESIRVVIRWG